MGVPKIPDLDNVAASTVELLPGEYHGHHAPTVDRAVMDMRILQDYGQKLFGFRRVLLGGSWDHSSGHLCHSRMQ